VEYNIPLFKLNFDKQEEEAVVETIRSKWISTGPKCTELESMFKNMLHVNNAVSLSNCTDALHLALRVLNIQEGDEVICPSLTFAATVNSIRYLNALPVFADISSPEDLSIDPKSIEEKITSKTKAIIVVHFAGFPCDMQSITAIAKKYDLKVIEDSCHGPLSEYQGNKLGTIGDIGCFSFFSNKNISTGEGGMIVTNNDDYERRIRLLRSHGMTTMSYERAKGHATTYDIVDLGYNFRLDDIRASIGIVQMKKLPEDLNKRAIIRSLYLERLLLNPFIFVPYSENSEFVSNYILPVVLKNSTSEKRDRIREKLHEIGIQTSVHYPAVHRFTIYSHLQADLPNTEYVTDNEITLPMYSTLTNAEIEFICSSLLEILTNDAND
jgi:dTDP-4-amino-4,6-dideoxygalactose transaminase